MEALLAIILVCGILFLISIYHGFVLMLLWKWFIVPLGVSSIGIAQAIGISILLSMFIGIDISREQKDWEVALITPLVFLLMGYVAKHFM